jgi:hypothetical protein
VDTASKWKKGALQRFYYARLKKNAPRSMSKKKNARPALPH